MNRQFRYHFKKFFLPVFSAVLFLYVLYHILNGAHGWFSWRFLETELEKSHRVLSVLELEEQKLHNKVQRMRPEHLDRDLLDERARDMLNLAEEQDTVIVDETIGP